MGGDMYYDREHGTYVPEQYGPGSPYDSGSVSSTPKPPTHHLGSVEIVIGAVELVYDLLPAHLKLGWEKLKPFLLEPGNPDKLREAADAWDGKGSARLFDDKGALVKRLNESEADVRGFTSARLQNWHDDAADNFRTYIDDIYHRFSNLKTVAKKIGTCLRALADAMDTFNTSLRYATASLAVAVIATTAGVVATEGFGTPLVAPVLIGSIGSFLTFGVATAKTYLDLIGAPMTAMRELAINDGEFALFTATSEHGGHPWPRLGQL